MGNVSNAIQDSISVRICNATNHDAKQKSICNATINIKSEEARQDFYQLLKECMSLINISALENSSVIDLDNDCENNFQDVVEDGADKLTIVLRFPLFLHKGK